MPVGGVRVLYSHSQMVNDLADERVNSQIFHWWDVNFVCNWFEHTAARKIDKALNPDEHFVIFAESQMYTMWREMVEQGIRYGIFVQNGYVLDGNIAPEDIAQAYDKASLIISISDDATQCIEFLFPQHMHKLVQVQPSVDPTLFHVDHGISKSKVLTYMPRKSPRDLQLVNHYLRIKLPPGWTTKAIEGLNQEGVAKALQDSPIFISFSELEGFGLPPIEAALCGNLVVGYHGEGGREYWHQPLFTEVPRGHIRLFTQSVLEQIARIESKGIDLILQETEGARQALALRYSKENELLAMRNLVERVLKTFDPA